MRDASHWNHSQLNRYIDSYMDGFTEEQVGHMAWYLGVRHEQMLREKEATMNQGEQEEQEETDFRVKEEDLVK